MIGFLPFLFPYIMKKIILILSVILLAGCSSSRLVDHWKSPDYPSFEANKVLVVGLAQDREVRRDFESMLAFRLEKNGVRSVRSIDFFEDSFTDEKRTEKELDELESMLLDAGFDAILLSKVTGTEEKMTTVQSVRDFTDTFQNFKQDYYESQDILYNKNVYEEYTLYHAETNLYCICPDKEREILWQGQIDIVDQKVKKNMTDYVALLTKTLKDQKMLIVN